MITRVFRNIFFVNKYTSEQLAKSSSILVCKQNAFEKYVNKEELIKGDQFFKEVLNNDETFKIYQKMAPYIIMSKSSATIIYYVVKAEYFPEVRTLKFVVMDTAGFFVKFVNIDDFIPSLWEDYYQNLIWNMPPTEEIDTEMVFRNGTDRSFFVFSRTCEWKTDGVNHPDFDFRKLFKESEWIDEQIAD